MSYQRAARFFAAASVLGSAAWCQTARCAAWTVENGLPNTDFAASVSSAGDVNGDGYGDVLVGAPAITNGQKGHAYLYLGSPTGLATTPAWTLEGDPRTLLGTAVASAGDVNGDGFDDVIIGVPWFENGQTLEGAAFVYLGSASGLATSPAWTAEGNQLGANLQFGAHFGLSVATAGDVNGDGFSDVIVGAPSFTDGTIRQDGEGGAFVYLGSASGLGTSPAWHVEGNLANTYLGDSVASAGDVNGDGFSDVIVGAWEYTPRGGQTWEGRALAYLGSASGLATEPNWKADGDQARELFGGAVAAAGDVNGDGYGDVIVGASFVYDGDPSAVGHASVYLGSAMGLARSLPFAGDQVNADTIEAMDVILGMTWSAPLTIHHPHGGRGLLALSVRTTAINGPTFLSPIGGRTTQILISGPLLATIPGSHSLFFGDIPSQPVPLEPSLLGLHWAAQYTVVGGGFADLSQAVYGVVDSCP